MLNPPRTRGTGTHRLSPPRETSLAGQAQPEEPELPPPGLTAFLHGINPRQRENTESPTPEGLLLASFPCAAAGTTGSTAGPAPGGQHTALQGGRIGTRPPPRPGPAEPRAEPRLLPARGRLRAPGRPRASGGADPCAPGPSRWGAERSPVPASPRTYAIALRGFSPADPEPVAAVAAGALPHLTVKARPRPRRRRSQPSGAAGPRGQWRSRPPPAGAGPRRRSANGEGRRLPRVCVRGAAPAPPWLAQAQAQLEPPDVRGALGTAGVAAAGTLRGWRAHGPQIGVSLMDAVPGAVGCPLRREKGCCPPGSGWRSERLRARGTCRSPMSSERLSARHQRGLFAEPPGNGLFVFPPVVCALRSRWRLLAPRNQIKSEFSDIFEHMWLWLDCQV